MLNRLWLVFSAWLYQVLNKKNIVAICGFIICVWDVKYPGNIARTRHSNNYTCKATNAKGFQYKKLIHKKTTETSLYASNVTVDDIDFGPVDDFKLALGQFQIELRSLFGARLQILYQKNMVL